ncbi:MAG: PD-(D/E)XK motif protein [Adhaeribacter sp.]
MTENLINPWASMQQDSVRRIDSKLMHNIFWMTDSRGNYGLYLKCSNKFEGIETDINLKGITLVKRNIHDFGEMFLIVNNQADWQMFLTLCNDLVIVCSKYDNSEIMIFAVENRLRRWQLFLKQETRPSMSVEAQMGLFSELICLKDLIFPSLEIKTGVLAWVGPESDNQDFSLPNIFIEVKSYKSSKGPKVLISSPNQLYSNSKPIFLCAIGLTQTDQGKSIVDLVDELDLILSNESVSTIQTFEARLNAYGFVPGINVESMVKFKVDGMKLYEIREGFPKISPEMVPPKIVSLKYTIDLGQCKEYEKYSNSIFK